MGTTALFVEIVVIGAVAEIWIFLAILATINYSSYDFSKIDSIGRFSTLLVIPFLALTYALGWIVNFGAERLFKFRFQKRWRDELFRSAAVDYETARALISQCASERTNEDLKFDRHILRLSRSSALQLPLIAASLSLYFRIAPVTIGLVIVLCLALSVAAFFQWISRYKSNYKKVLKIYQVLKQP